MSSDNGLTDDLLERGLQLAYFIYPHRPIAIEVLRRALTKLKGQRSREVRRSYWRDKHLKTKITRTIRNEQDMLQWLIYREAEHYEKQQELAGEQSLRDMVVRYVKHLVQLTTAMSSFYVNVGIQRLLRNYNTPATQQLYEAVSDHYPGAEEYRRIKGVLMRKLDMRFHSMLKTYRVNHGEVRFEPMDSQEKWADLIDECLTIFTPWSTRQACSSLARFDSEFGYASKIVFGNNHQGVQRDAVEANRSHVFIEPVCHGRISERLGLSAPGEKLSVPHFHVDVKNDDFADQNPSQGKTSKLTEHERKQLFDKLAEDTRPRNQEAAAVYSIVIDGTECAVVNSNDEAAQSWEIPEGMKLLEVWSHGGEERFLAATHWIEYTEYHGIAEATAVISLDKRREMLLQLDPIRPPFEMAGGASILLKCRPVSRISAWMRTLNLSTPFFRISKLAFALTSAMALLGLLATIRYGLQSVRERERAQTLIGQLASEKAQRASLEQRLSVAHAVYQLTPEEFRTRSGASAKIPVVSVPAGAELITLNLPVSGTEKSYRATLKSFLQNQDLLSESSLHPTEMNGGMEVALVLPVSLLDNQKHYVVDLYGADQAGRWEKIRVFAFYVVEQQAAQP